MGVKRHAAVVLCAGAAVLALASCGFAGIGPADSITDHSARVLGSIGNTDMGDTRFHFEYGTTDAYGTSTPEGVIPITDVHAAVPVGSNTLEGLAEATTYHYRLCAFDGAGRGGCSADATFTTTSGHDYVIGTGLVDSVFGPHGGQADVTAGHDGSDPQGVLNAYEADPAFHPRYDSFAISCLRVEGHRATIGALVGIPGVTPQLRPLLAFIEDGGTTGTPDKWATKWLDGTNAPTCPVPNEADFPPLVIRAPFPPNPLITIPHEIPAGRGYDFVVHDHP